MAADWSAKYLLPPNGHAAIAALQGAVDAMRERGATFMRATSTEGFFVIEGWEMRPDDQGALPDIALVPLAGLLSANAF